MSHFIDTTVYSFHYYYYSFVSITNVIHLTHQINSHQKEKLTRTQRNFTILTETALDQGNKAILKCNARKISLKKSKSYGLI